MLCVDGVEIAQSMTIARYCAAKFGLAGSNALENAQMDEVVDAISEATEKQYNAFLFEKVGYVLISQPTKLIYAVKKKLEGYSFYLKKNYIAWNFPLLCLGLESSKYLYLLLPYVIENV